MTSGVGSLNRPVPVLVISAQEKYSPGLPSSLEGGSEKSKDNVIILPHKVCEVCCQNQEVCYQDVDLCSVEPSSREAESFADEPDNPAYWNSVDLFHFFPPFFGLLFPALL